MKWLLLDPTHTVLATCDANTKLGAVAKLKPTDGQFVASEASFRVGYPRRVAEALREGSGICTFCGQRLTERDRRPRTTLHQRCYRKQSVERRFYGP